MNNVTIYDNGACFMVCINGLMSYGFNSLGSAWNHIAWMYRVASQEFTVGKTKVPVKQWLENMVKCGYLDNNVGYCQ